MLANWLTHWITRRPGATRASLGLMRRLGGDVAKLGDDYFALSHKAVIEILSNHHDLTVGEANRSAFVTGPVLLYTDDGTAYRSDKAVLNDVVNDEFMSCIEATIDERIEHYLRGRNGGANSSDFDVVADYAEPIVAEVIARHFLGLEIGAGQDDLQSLRTNLRVLGTTLVDGEVSSRAERAGHYVTGLIEKRKGMPEANDLAAELWHRSDPGVQSCPGSVAGLGLAATATVARGFGQIVDQLIKRPEVLGTLTQSRLDSRVLDQAIRECLRFNPVLVFIRRHAVRDVHLSEAAGGRVVRSGSRVMVSLSQAMFDSKAFPAPYEFRLDRPANNYLHFGHALHRCFGAPIAELLLRKMLAGVLSAEILEQARTRYMEFDSWALSNYVISQKGG